MINFFTDLIKYFKYKKYENIVSCGFFCESNFIFGYLEPYINNKLKRRKIVIICFEDIDCKIINQDLIFVFKSNFFRQLVFLTLNLKYLYSSTPDLNNTIFTKSKLNKCKYIYLQHSPVSLTMIYNEKAFNEFDAIQVISQYQLAEIIEIKNKYNLKIKLIKSKYLFVQKQIKYSPEKKMNDLLIAPSWNSNFYKLKCHEILKTCLELHKITYKIRPHPMSYFKNEISKKDLIDLGMSIDESVNINFNEYNFFISDWSGLFIEYALIFKRKSHLINTPKKIFNKNYMNFSSTPVEISLRNILCETYEINQIKDLVNRISFLKDNQNFEQDHEVKKIIEKNFF